MIPTVVHFQPVFSGKHQVLHVSYKQTNMTTFHVINSWNHNIIFSYQKLVAYITKKVFDAPKRTRAMQYIRLMATDISFIYSTGLFHAFPRSSGVLRADLIQIEYSIHIESYSNRILFE